MSQMETKPRDECGRTAKAASEDVFTMRKAFWHCEPNSFGAKDAGEKGGLGVPLLVTVEPENQKQCKAHGFAPGVSTLGYWRIKSKVRKGRPWATSKAVSNKHPSGTREK